MRRRRVTRRPRGGMIALAVLAGVNLVVAVTASLFVPPSFAGNQVQPITAEDLKPAECAALVLTTVIGNAGAVAGTEASDLLLGSELIDIIEGSGGGDCLVGGPGDDALTGGAGVDVCLGGPGVDTFVGCETEIQ